MSVLPYLVNEDGATVADFDVAGLPIPQGSMRAFARRGGGRPIVTGDNPRTKPWKAAVTAAAAEARQWICAGPVVVEIDFRLPRPKSHYGRRGTVLPSAPSYPTTKPDVDKLERAILDALTEARVWHDDSQVVALSAIKLWSEEPGAHVRVVAL
jgi:Holliday junction resolvase RusA-like endonuclease